MSIPIEFESEGERVLGKFHKVAGDPPRATVLLLAGFPGNEEDVLGLGGALSQKGIDTVTFNYRGTYGSEGSYSLRNSLADIGAAYAYLQQKETRQLFGVVSSQMILGGWSFGGGMGLTYAANHPEVTRLFSIAGTDHGEFAREYERNAAFAEMIDMVFDELRAPEGPVNFAGAGALAELLQDPEPYDLVRLAPALADRDLLIVGGWKDPNVVIENHILPVYRQLIAAGAPHVKIAALEDGHDFANVRSELASLISDWIRH